MAARIDNYAAADRRRRHSGRLGLTEWCEYICISRRIRRPGRREPDDRHDAPLGPGYEVGQRPLQIGGRGQRCLCLTPRRLR
jgi:hypothetical protein